MNTRLAAPSRISWPRDFLACGIQPTAVFESYWRFAVERQRIWQARVNRLPAPWTQDQILASYKFTNVFRVQDRVSQKCVQIADSGVRLVQPGSSKIPLLFGHGRPVVRREQAALILLGDD
jgi:5-hmdU DNA kinase-like protein